MTACPSVGYFFGGVNWLNTEFATLRLADGGGLGPLGVLGADDGGSEPLGGGRGFVTVGDGERNLPTLGAAVRLERHPGDGVLVSGRRHGVGLNLLDVGVDGGG